MFDKERYQHARETMDALLDAGVNINLDAAAEVFYIQGAETRDDARRGARAMLDQFKERRAREHQDLMRDVEATSRRIEQEMVKNHGYRSAVVDYELVRLVDQQGQQSLMSWVDAERLTRPS